jgi:hypothetical protein
MWKVKSNSEKKIRVRKPFVSKEELLVMKPGIQSASLC